MCKGAGQVKIEMVYMADVYVGCDTCGGARYNRELLEVRIRGKNVSEILELTVTEAIRFFIRERKLGRKLWQLEQVGLGYLRLGQAATTLSGGEAQRLKIAREFTSAAGRRGRKLYMLDAPTTGPGAGARGGEVEAMGTPERVAKVPESVTGHYLVDLLS